MPVVIWNEDKSHGLVKAEDLNICQGSWPMQLTVDQTVFNQTKRVKLCNGLVSVKLPNFVDTPDEYIAFAVYKNPTADQVLLVEAP